MATLKLALLDPGSQLAQLIPLQIAEVAAAAAAAVAVVGALLWLVSTYRQLDYPYMSIIYLIALILIKAFLLPDRGGSYKESYF